jgi:putative membrane protein
MLKRVPSDVWLMLVVFAVATAWSLVQPADWATWFFEITPGGIGLLVLAAVSPWRRFSRLLYFVVAVHFVILAAGAKYTYAEMPLFNWLRDSFHLSRNYFDRVGHFFQGFTAALLTREILLRWTPLQTGKIVSFLSCSVALAFSAFYELLEWQWVEWFYPGKGTEWLGMQGDPWDAQSDMAMALCGAIAVVGFLTRIQDASIRHATLPPKDSLPLMGNRGGEASFTVTKD